MGLVISPFLLLQTGGDDDVHMLTRASRGLVLRLAPVGFTMEFFSLADHRLYGSEASSSVVAGASKKPKLSVMRLRQESGSATSLTQVAETIMMVLRRQGGLLVEEEEVAREMCRVLDILKSRFGLFFLFFGSPESMCVCMLRLVVGFLSVHFGSSFFVSFTNRENENEKGI